MDVLREDQGEYTVDFHSNELQGESYSARQNRSSLQVDEEKGEEEWREEEEDED